MSKTAKYWENEYSILPHVSRIKEHRTNDYVWLDGCVLTKHGIVDVYADDSYSVLSLVTQWHLL